ncbi:MAG: hypothetical protein AAF740_11480 [Bacteroidota bacterium]
MKIRNSFLTAVLMLFSFTILAQEVEKNVVNKVYENGEQLVLRRNIFKLTPGDFFNSTFTVGLETLNKSRTRSFNIHFNVRSGDTWEGDISGFGGEVSYRFYAGRGLVIQESKKGNRFIQGAYFAPFLRAGYLNREENFQQQVYDPVTNTWDITDINDETEVIYFFPGLYVGWQRTFWDLIYMDVFLGGGVRMSDVKYSDPRVEDRWSDGILDVEYNGVAPRVGINLGISF